MLLAVKEGEIPNTNFSELSMSDAIQYALNLYSYRGDHEKDLVHFDEVNNFQFWGDREVFANILMNLIKNALFFIAKTGSGEITIWMENKADYNELHVKDTGPGMTEKTLSHLFEDFFTNREGETGLGLTFCRKAMHAFKGEIRCQSELGEYTEFVMKFPQVEKK